MTAVARTGAATDEPGVTLMPELPSVQHFEAWIQENDLGPDALDDVVDRACFRERIGNRRGSLKGALMNQSVVAGVGSEYADEILYQAELHPESRVPALTDDDLDEIRRVMRRGAPHRSRSECRSRRVARVLAPAAPRERACVLEMRRHHRQAGGVGAAHLRLRHAPAQGALRIPENRGPHLASYNA